MMHNKHKDSTEEKIKMLLPIYQKMLIDRRLINKP
jgi:hypothetical protein